MAKSNICLLILVAFIFVSCKPHYTENETILRAESLLNSSPDSAYNLLSSIRQPEKLSKADYAAWCLHFTHAQYKLYQDIKSDSLIRISVNYYTDSKLYKQSGTAYYLLGCILQLNNKNQDAMLAYKQAEELMQKTNEENLKGLIDFKIGYIYKLDEIFSQSLIFYKKSLKYFIRSKNNGFQAYAYRELSDSYYLLDYPFDSVMHYSELAVKLAKETGDTSYYYNCLSRQGELLYNRNYARSKDLLLKAYRHFPAQQSYYAAYLSFTYSMLDMPDSARYYFQLSLKDSVNTNTQNLKFLLGAYVARGEGNHTIAFQYFEKAYYNRDSIYLKNTRNQLYRIDKQYDLTQKTKENAELKIANQYKVIMITLLIIVVLFIFIILLLASDRQKKLNSIHELERQRLEYEVRAKHNVNEQKRELLMTKLQSRIENTLRFNHLKTGCLQQDKQNAFMAEITKQSVISESEWQYYINEVNQLHDGSTTRLIQEFPELTQSDLIVISFICLQVDISDTCNLLNMNRNTMYTRRSIIKKRVGIDKEVEVEDWLKEYMGKIKI